MLLQNHIAAVTGAGSGIGRAIALGYAREGAQVAVLDINSEAAAETAKQIGAAGGKAKAFTLDVTKRDDCLAMAKKVADEVGPVSILVNNAGITRRNAFTADADTVAKDWQDILAVNLNGMFNVTQAFLAAAARQQGAHRQPRLDPVLHAPAHAVIGRLHHLEARRAGFTKALAAELGKDGVRVNAIGPGFIETPLNEKVRAERPELVKIFIDHTPLGRAGKPEDIVGPAIFLASDLSAYVTGAAGGCVGSAPPGVGGAATVSTAVDGDATVSRTASTIRPVDVDRTARVPLVGPELAPLRRPVEQDLREVDDLGAVHQGLVGLGEHGDAAALEPLDEVDLPQGPVAVQWTGDDPGDQLAQLVHRPGTRQRRAAYVVAEVEVGVVHPDRVRQVAGTQRTHWR